MRYCKPEQDMALNVAEQNIHDLIENYTIWTDKEFNPKHDILFFISPRLAKPQELTRNIKCTSNALAAMCHKEWVEAVEIEKNVYVFSNLLDRKHD